MDNFYSKKQTGDLGEKLALDYLKKKKYKILETNYRYSRKGEIDIIAKDKKTKDLVFIEVKTRRDSRFGWPEVSVNQKKRRRLLPSLKTLKLNDSIKTRPRRLWSGRSLLSVAHPGSHLSPAEHTPRSQARGIINGIRNG